MARIKKDPDYTRQAINARTEYKQDGGNVNDQDEKVKPEIEKKPEKF